MVRIQLQEYQRPGRDDAAESRCTTTSRLPANTADTRSPVEHVSEVCSSVSCQTDDGTVANGYVLSGQQIEYGNM